MTSIRLLLAGLLGALSLVLLTPTVSHACSCVMASVDDHVEWSDVIFTGTLVDVAQPPERPVMSSADPVTYTFDVDSVYEGDVDRTAEVTTAMSGASCGLEGLRVATSYVVFAEGGNSRLSASLCGGTGPARPGVVRRLDQVLGPSRPATGPPDLVALLDTSTTGALTFVDWW